jgi:hypothetical protein
VVKQDRNYTKLLMSFRADIEIMKHIKYFNFKVPVITQKLLYKCYNTTFTSYITLIMIRVQNKKKMKKTKQLTLTFFSYVAFNASNKISKSKLGFKVVLTFQIFTLIT